MVTRDLTLGQAFDRVPVAESDPVVDLVEARLTPQVNALGAAIFLALIVLWMLAG